MNRFDSQDDDRPLQGPWSRRPVEAPPERNDYPEQEAGAGYGSRNEYDDEPLQGPWGRRPAETPPERNDSPGGGAEAGYRSRDYDDVPGPNQWNQEREVPTLSREGPENDSVVHGQSFRIKKRESEDAGTEQRAIPECPREAVTEKPYNDCPDSGHPRALLNNLFSPSGIYAGIIMAEVLGGRGGRNRLQSSVAGRQNRRY